MFCRNSLKLRINVHPVMQKARVVEPKLNVALLTAMRVAWGTLMDRDRKKISSPGGSHQSRAKNLQNFKIYLAINNRVNEIAKIVSFARS